MCSFFGPHGIPSYFAIIAYRILDDSAWLCTEAVTGGVSGVTSNIIIAVVCVLLTVSLCVLAVFVLHSLYVARRKRSQHRQTPGRLR